MIKDIDKFILDQLSVWPVAARNYRLLRSVPVRQVEVDGILVTLQHNPQRIVSTAARTDKASVGARPCFLCESGRPQEQTSLKAEGRKGRRYDILVNRYPIFQRHLVISAETHGDQSIWHRFTDLLDMTRHLEGYVIMYNGPHCGASAPDHLHFQACPRGYLPLERTVDRLLSSSGEAASGMEHVTTVRDSSLWHFRRFSRGIFVLEARTAKSMAKLFYRLLDCMNTPEGESEPRFNVMAWSTGEVYRAIVTARAAHRPHHFYSRGEDRLTISPGCTDMAGYMVLPFEDDYRRINPSIIREILSEVSVNEEDERMILWRLTRTQPKLEVGIMLSDRITFEVVSDGAGPQMVSFREGKLDYNGALYDELYFEAATRSTLFAEPSFILHGVTIGIDFHWERKRDLVFAGTLKFIVENGKVRAINVIGVEDYLLSVISSEMKSTSDLEFLKAHAVISRSWVMAQIESRKAGRCAPAGPSFNNVPELVTYLDSSSGPKEKPDGQVREYVRWFDHDDHKLFDVCADDHCQRYQGLTMAVGENVRKAVDLTWGEVLTYGGKICDARFSKCCGGKTELFSTCWEDIDYPYLAEVDDPWCNTSDNSVLSKVLNDYDLETRDFYRWTVEYGVDELSGILRERSGMDFGTILDLVPLERGVSGRIKKLRIVGTKLTMDIGKELIIRRFLSRSHLKSSAFDIEFKDHRVIFRGSGWGHGVGLCQIGAANMAAHGASYREILGHYYPGAGIYEGK